MLNVKTFKEAVTLVNKVLLLPRAHFWSYPSSYMECPFIGLNFVSPIPRGKARERAKNNNIKPVQIDAKVVAKHPLPIYLSVALFHNVILREKSPFI